MWGAENVEMAFRTWMCGGRVECTPCARTYHIYRHGGSGYRSPGELSKKNRVRTARLWLDEYYQVARYFNNDTDVDQGSYDKMLALKERLKCKGFQWFLDNVDPQREGIDMNDYGVMSSIKNLGTGVKCIDNLGHKGWLEDYGLYHCHGMGGSQGWFEIRSAHKIRNMSNENNCLCHDFKFSYCERKGEDDRWHSVPEKQWITWAKTEKALEHDNYMDPEAYECLAVDKDKLAWKPCVDGDPYIQWEYTIFQRDPDFKPLQYSREWQERQSLTSTQ
eukprot:Protomagalhaensia_wolfi_Nauph_80__2710@NODE_2842_length_971_cov_7_341202_g2229_i0_p1_GENE_NODE_2842_length_971_cov_7_341202_g2229_i0NODE_2842_length_971_cov_7_341202_g2229_i0_p1_ORF_typecomplete_len276_score42_62Ricin_B_lectin/PF00652_22/3_2e06Ricin_B_lectin/PF00652_22/5_7Glyco_transf_7C/PF02709_14/7_8e05_NODE_2842_length_971_cov_7_341202_g2229_i03830